MNNKFTHHDIIGTRYYYDNKNNLIVAHMNLLTGSYSCDYESFNQLKLSDKLFLLGLIKNDSICILIGECKYV